MSSAHRRVLGLVAAARRIANAGDPVGLEARRILPLSTGLSAPGVELALGRALETRPTAAELGALLRSVDVAPRAWVLLSANVFTAALRAVALAFVASDDVRVRASRREPEMAGLLARVCDAPFALVEEIRPAPGDVVFAYGRDETLVSVASSLPPGVRLAAHGSGLGVAVVRPEALTDAELADVARRLALDVTLFDQRGCLSPRLVLAVGSVSPTVRLAEACASALATAERVTPLGRVGDDERAALTRYRQTIAFAGDVLAAGRGVVGVVTGDEAALAVPPPGRNLHVAQVTDPVASLATLAPHVAAVGVDDAGLRARLAAALPLARCSAIGAMQTPPLDGPVDRRARERLTRPA